MTQVKWFDSFKIIRQFKTQLNMLIHTDLFFSSNCVVFDLLKLHVRQYTEKRLTVLDQNCYELKKLCISYFSHCCNNLSDKSSFKKEVWDHRLKVELVMMGKASGYIVSSVRSQSSGAPQASFYVLILGPQPMGRCCVPSSVYPFWKHPHRDPLTGLFPR